MITVDTIGRVRRAHFVQGKSIKAIARELRLAPNTDVHSSNGRLLDRLTHHVHILEMNGDSFRLAHSKRRSRRQRQDPPDAAPQA